MRVAGSLLLPRLGRSIKRGLAGVEARVAIGAAAHAEPASGRRDGPSAGDRVCVACGVNAVADLLLASAEPGCEAAGRPGSGAGDRVVGHLRFPSGVRRGRRDAKPQ